MIETAFTKARIPFRSLLFVPGDSERKLAKAEDCAADALILDLEDSVAPSRTCMARGLVLDYLNAHVDRSRRQLWVRINPLSAPAALLDLNVLAGRPDGLILPKVDSAHDVTRLSHMLDALEAREGLAAGCVDIIPVATETPAALFTLGSYAGCSGRLTGLTWGAEDIAAALGASTNRGPDGEYDVVYQLARALCLTGAVAAGVQPIDTIWSNFTDTAGLERDARLGRQRGFTGKMAIHPAQVPVINEVFTPTADAVAKARTIIAAFDANPGKGAVAIEGVMYDRPHLERAKQLLARAVAAGIS